ncbi:hypothetical protein BUH_5995 [Burkholderia pseudomallei Pakistan 9]|uniref:Uncharacterized protein n=1 Tax=Burkholderia mallei (strain NCTC 10229) TaxID=412022 RepID=A2RWU7_BURM9|nr:hypothetical protein BMASAVP1_0078 [Burkholderia mallei SAVP1]ABM98564.1 hypothetical protein BMA10229_0342 [Burkholderia mallei NCTC 10229]EDK55241.1 hypothetical protein BMAFMH_E0242 [Burkholderia mallei FMH]EDK61231.1 hypothetical protein BMAJHU_I0238 [Burkholderia mallei JHU]EDO94412.1 hypothetical protein BURPSPAST_V0051 [Burkholderia pseudomallei Pasteur 52237]EDP85269.1 hypothetical protein BMA10399_G0419 [Burkholderia mallei ATCC 10399]EEH25980.1 hypothetical protein BUH_5995 [Burk
MRGAGAGGRRACRAGERLGSARRSRSAAALLVRSGWEA